MLVFWGKKSYCVFLEKLFIFCVLGFWFVKLLLEIVFWLFVNIMEFGGVYWNFCF